MASPDLVWPLLVSAQRVAWLLCALIVAGAFTAWWLSVDAAARRSTKQAVVPRLSPMVWLDNGGGNVGKAWRSDVRGYRSPLLFALPTPPGFSCEALAGPCVENFKRSPVTASETRPSDSDIVSVAVIPRTTARDFAAAGDGLTMPPMDISTPEEINPPATDSVFVLVWQPDGQRPSNRILPAGRRESLPGEPSWEVVARIDLDARGWPDHVLLDRSSASSNRNPQIIRSIYGLNFGTNSAAHGRVTIRFEGTGSRPVSTNVPEGMLPAGLETGVGKP